MSFLEELIKEGVIDKSQIGEIKESAEEKYKGNIDEALIASGVTEDKILEVKGKYLNMPIKKVGIEDSSFDALKYISEDSAMHYHFAPIVLRDGVLEVGVTNGEDVQALDALQFISAKVGIPFKIYLISKSDYETVLQSYKGIGSQVKEALSELEQEKLNETKIQTDENLSKEIKNIKDGTEEKIVEYAQVIKIVAVILRNAIDGGASDIHIEYTGEKVKVRFRVDGILHTTILLPSNIYSGIVARIKILARLRLDERRKPHDQLGLSETNLNMIKKALEKPYGLILITGPTGSGKSTTLYSMMNELDKEVNNIVSLEDPVEYHMPSINQSQMMPEIGYTFASGLRSILRQDPDIIMVGEIRDKETAQLAVQAALTVHLVLSTLHTNSAVGAIPRLVDMGVDPYLIAPTLILSVAQRLARLIYPASRKEIPMDESVRTQVAEQLRDLPEKFKPPIGDKMYEVVPSPECPSGTRGRIAVFEMFKVDKEMQTVILKNPVNSEIYRVARKNGMLIMREDAMLKSLQGLIPFTEVYNFNNETD